MCSCLPDVQTPKSLAPRSVRVGRCDKSYLASSESVWIAVTECHRLGGLNSKHLFLTVLEAGHVRSGRQHKGPLPGLQMAAFLCLHMEGREGLREQERCEREHQSQGGSIPITSSSPPCYPSKTPSSNTTTLETQASMHESGGDTNIAGAEVNIPGPYF